MALYRRTLQAAGRPFPARVSKIYQQAEFTPKSVETAEERQKLLIDELNRRVGQTFTLAELAAACELSEAAIRELAREYATTRPASILLGWGLNIVVGLAGLLDELCLTIGPQMAGPGAPRIVAGTPGTGPVATPLPLTLAHVLEDDGFLLCRYTRPRSSVSRSATASQADSDARPAVASAGRLASVSSA